MIDKTRLLAQLKIRYSSFDQVGERVLRCVDTYNGAPYAVRYFDFSDDIVSIAKRLSEYQEHLLGSSFFDAHSKADLRWNHYLYFLTSTDGPTNGALATAKALIESDREYARKFVLPETELFKALIWKSLAPKGDTPPRDPLSEWLTTLEKHSLGFIVDESLQVPAVARHIVKGDKKGLKRPPASPTLGDAEQAVGADFLKSLVIRQFRQFPLRKEYDFGAVNLISGVNGVGKTSLLESLEYLFCGRVRRSSDAKKVSLSGDLRKSGLTLETTSQTSDAKLRERHLVWYGKADVRAVKLHDSFGKFNFLDTDAAAQLTVERSQERINADLAQLLLGAESAKALKRFENLQKELQGSVRDLERQVAIHDERRISVAIRLDDLRKLPKESDELANQVHQSLRRANWNAPIDGPAQVSELIEGALLNIGLIKAAGPAVPQSAKERQKELTGLTAARDTAVKMQGRRRELDGSHTSTIQRERLLEQRLKAAGDMEPILKSGLGEIVSSRSLKDQRLAALVSVLGRSEAAAVIVAEEKGLMPLPLRDAIEAQSRERDRQSTALAAVRRTLEALESTQAALTNLKEQLRDVARNIIDHTHDSTHCPLCGTEFAKSELKRITGATAPLSLSTDAQSLRLNITELESAYKRSLAVLEALSTLSTHPAAVDKSVPVEAIVRHVGADRKELAKVQAEKDALDAQIGEFAKRGWTIQRLTELARVAGLDASGVDKNSLVGIMTALREDLEQRRTELANFDKEIQTLDGQIEEIRNLYQIDSRSVREVIAALASRINTLEQVSRARESLSGQLKMSSFANELEIEAFLREGQQLTTRWSTAIHREAEIEEGLKRDTKALEEAVAEVKALRVQLKRAASAGDVIDALIETQSSQALTEQVLRENGAEIAATFSRIHAPNEFDVEVGDDGLKITRRTTKARVELNEMSSGQRAAFALSLFLAMNGRLQTGPKVIIFDDPVAHVDDINTLSFLDHLREIAVAGDRQLFFATADSKLAALFSRKFRFLGDQFVHIELSRA